MTLSRLLTYGIHILTIITMSASSAYLISSSFVFERWLEEPLLDTLGWNSAALAWTLFGLFAAEGLMLSFLGHWPGLYTLFLFLLFLPSLYAHSSLGWLEFAGLEVEAALSKAVVGALAISLTASYLMIRMAMWIGNTQRDFQQRNADPNELRSTFYFSASILLVVLGLATGLGLGLAFSVESTGSILSDLFGSVPLGVLTIGITSVAAVAWAIGRLITSQNLLSRDLWQWRR